MLRPCPERSPNLNFSRGQRAHGQEPNVFASKFDAYSGPPSRSEFDRGADDAGDGHYKATAKTNSEPKKERPPENQGGRYRGKSAEVADARQPRKQIQNQRKNYKGKSAEVADARQPRKQIQNQRKNARLKGKAAATKAKARKVADARQMPAAGGRRAMIL